MRTLILATFLIVPSFGQGWTQLSNTTFNSVSAPDNFTSTFGGHTMPPTDGGAPGASTFAQNHYRILSQWERPIVDTKRHRLVFWGGGHDGPNDNSIQVLDLVSVSTSSATCGGQSCITTSNTGSVPAMTRINDPSVFVTGCPQPINWDGTPQSMQTWGGTAYLPRADKYFYAPNATVCPDNIHPTWLFDPTVSPGNPAAWIAGPTAPDDGNAGKECAVVTTAAGLEAVECIGPNTFMSLFTCLNTACTSNSWTTQSNGNWTLQSGNSGSVVYDPDRRTLYVIGPAFNGTGGAIWAIGIDTPTVATNLTSSFTGCTDLIGWPYPSVTWDPSIHKIVGYVPQSASAQGTASNIIYIIDPAMMTCTVQPQLGGSGPSATGHIIGAPGSPAFQGTSGFLALFPELGYYVLVNNEAANAYKFVLNATNTNGLGSSTITCVDRDGDGYGVGSGCTGPDADDQDSAVHTAAQFISKWTDIPTGLRHLGYNPTNIWYLSPSGVDTGSPAACKNTVGFGSPCATAAYVYSHGFAAGDMILRRGGAYTEFVSPTTGSAGNPSIVMDYPGELSTTTSSGGSSDGIDLTESQIYVVIDGGRITGSGAANGCILGAENTNIAMRHIETASCAVWGIDFQGDTTGTSGCPGTGCRPLNDITVEDSSLHDSAGQHGWYYSSHENSVATNIFVRRTLSYNNNWNGFHTTGKFSNLIWDQLITYSNGLSGYSWQNGTSNSRLSNSLSLNDTQGMDITLYPGTGDPTCSNGAPYPIGTVCPFAQSNNLIINNSFYLTGTSPSGSANAGTFAITLGRQGTCTNTSCVNQVMTGNTFSNNILQTNNSNGGGTSAGDYPPLQLPDSTGTTYLSGTNFNGIIAKNLSFTGVIGYGPGGSFGYTPYTCTQLATMAASSTNCTVTDPLFISASTSFWNSIASFNLGLSSGSPALGTGTTINAPAYDLYGVALSSTAPSMGSIQTAGTPPVTGGGSVRLGSGKVLGSAVVH